MKAGRILKLAGQNYIDRLPEHQRQPAIEMLNKLHAAADTFNEALAATHADAKLTAEGRAAAGSHVAARALVALNPVESEIQKLTERATALETGLLKKAAYKPPTTPAERISYEAQLREIRDSLRGLSADERLQVYRSSTDPLVLQAIETAPMTLSENRRRLEPFIDPAEQAAAVLARAEAADPKAAQTLAEVRSLAEVYRLAVGSVRKEILDEVPAAAGTPEPTVA